jgi:hypothetical protein
LCLFLQAAGGSAVVTNTSEANPIAQDSLLTHS